MFWKKVEELRYGFCLLPFCNSCREEWQTPTGYTPYVCRHCGSDDMIVLRGRWVCRVTTWFWIFKKEEKVFFEEKP